MPRRPARAARLAPALAVAGVVAGAVLGACGSSDPRDPGAFCTRLRTNQPALTDASDPAALVKLYRDLDQHAPLQIQDQWHQITELLSQVTAFDPNDAAAQQAALAAALRSQAAVTAVGAWARDTCKVDLGPIPTTVPFGGTGDSLLPTSTPSTTEKPAKSTTRTTAKKKKPKSGG